MLDYQDRESIRHLVLAVNRLAGSIIGLGNRIFVGLGFIALAVALT